jgi:folate-binding protein YgfZ
VIGAALPSTPDPGAAEVRAAGAPAVLLRGRRAGLPSIEFLADASALPALLAAAGEAARAEGGGPIGADALEVLRIEAGVPRLGAEFGPETLPQEAGLEALVSFTKGCFLGQEPVARLQTQGHTNRGLAGLLPETLPAPGDAVLAGGKEVGAVTSAAASPSLGRPVALALLRHAASAPGTALEVRGAAGPIRAAVTSLPFVV